MLERGGVTTRPKLFHNLRSSAQTDLAAKRPIHVVCGWLENTKAVAQEHYLQTTDADFEAAISLDVMSQETTRKTTRAVPELTSSDAHREPGNDKTPGNTGVSSNKVAVVGLEYPPVSSGIPVVSMEARAPMRAQQPDPANLTDDAAADEVLERLLAVWPILTAEARETLVNSAYALVGDGSTVRQH